MPTGLFNKLIYAARKIAFQFKEKQKMTIDDHVLEHMLFYHDLMGSNQENNKESRIVKADIQEALKRESVTELSLAIKLPPKLWEEHLKNIISELDESKQQLLGKLLLSSNKSSEDCESASFALSHEDWRVRANAANILAFLRIRESVPALIEALSSDTAGSAMSFCYIAYALGKLQGQEAKDALEKQLLNSDAWLRVDAAGALSYFSFSEVAQPLAVALLQEQESLDYMSYAISTKIKPANFLQASTNQEIKGGCRLIFGIIEAAEGSFNKDLVLETESHLCMPYLVKLAEKEADPIVLDTALNLCGWFSDFRDKIIATNSSISTTYLLHLEEQEAILTRISRSNDFKNKVLEIVNNATAQLIENRNAELFHALRLVGKLDISEAQTSLTQLLTESSTKLNANELKHAIIALSQLSVHEEENANLLIDLAKRTVNVEERQHLNKHKQPVLEENVSAIKTYWEILRALGNLVTDNAASFLARALNDYAPDMRSCALESIVEICEKDSKIALPQPIAQTLQTALKDPSPMVQLAALLGVAKLKQVDLINDILPLINAQENTVSKQAISSLAYLAKNGHGPGVKTILEDKIKTIKEEYKRKRILDILQNC
jgi:HEAT repeat protein